MSSITRSLPSRDLREGLSAVLGGVAFGSERIGITRHGKLTAVVISVDDFELLEELEMARDVAEFRAAQAADDGSRVTLEDLRDDVS